MKKILLFALALLAFQIQSQAQNFHHFGWLGHELLSYDFEDDDLCKTSFTIFDAQGSVNTYKATSCREQDASFIYGFDNDGHEVEGSFSVLPLMASFGGNYYGPGYSGQQGDCKVNFAMAGGHSTLQVTWPSKGLDSPIGFGVGEDNPNFQKLSDLTFGHFFNDGIQTHKAKFQVYNFHMDKADAIYLDVDWSMNPKAGGKIELNLRFSGALKAQTKLSLSRLL